MSAGALCHNTAFIFVTYDPQITHGKQMGNRKQTFLFSMWMVWFIAKSLTIFLLSVVARQRRCHTNFHDLAHEIIKGNIEWCTISLHIFGKEVIQLKSYWAKWPRKQVGFFHGWAVKGAESNILTCKPRSIFKTLGLITGGPNSRYEGRV